MNEVSVSGPGSEVANVEGCGISGDESPIRFHRFPWGVTLVLGCLLLRSFHGGSKHTRRELEHLETTDVRKCAAVLQYPMYSCPQSLYVSQHTSIDAQKPRD